MGCAGPSHVAQRIRSRWSGQTEPGKPRSLGSLLDYCAQLWEKLFFRNTVLENIAYFSAIRKQDPKKISTKLTQYAEQLNMAHLLKTQVGNLSTGERKKASILAGICTDAKLLILDEPSNGLDIDAVLELQSIVSNIRANGTITTILSSHDINMLSGAATKYVYLCKGKIVWQNNGEMEAAEIVEKYRTLVQEGKQ